MSKPGSDGLTGKNLPDAPPPGSKPLVYFACSIRGGRDEQPTYLKIVNRLKEYAHVYGEEFTDGHLTSLGTADLGDKDIFRRDTGWIDGSDAIVAEVTNPSLGVGYEIGYALSIGKPVLALFRADSGRNLSAMISGNPYVEVVRYNDLKELDWRLKLFSEHTYHRH